MKKNYISPRIKSREIDLRDSLLSTSDIQVKLKNDDDEDFYAGNGNGDDDF